MSNQEWENLIESKREELSEKIAEQWSSMLTEPVTSSMRAVVLLWDDGDITTGYRDQNSWSAGEHEGKALCVASFGSQYDDSREEFDDVDEYIDFMRREYPPDTDDIIENTLRDLKMTR